VLHHQHYADIPQEATAAFAAAVVADGPRHKHHPETSTSEADMSTHETTEAQQQPDELVGRLKRTELQREPSSIPGREIVQVLTEIPAGVESGWHTHPGEEVGYIVAGTVEMMIRDRPTLRLHAGDGFLIPPGTAHNAYDVGPETGRMLSTYIVEVGEPLASLVQ
jgi:quercetin dioxygenase-like cupin family protein